MRTCSLVLCAGLLALIGVRAVPASELLGVTEDVPPFSYMEDGRYRGFANEVLDRVAQRAGLRIQRSTQPWARALKTVEALPNSFLYITVRSPPRETQYRWVGPIDDCDLVVLALSGSGRRFDAAQTGALRIGAVRGAPTAATLRAAGVAEQNIYLTPGSETSTRMLYAGHLDLVAGLLLPYAYQASRIGQDPGRLSNVHTLQRGYGCYYAFNPRVDTALFDRFAQGFETLRASGELRQLRERYLNQAPR